MDSDLLSSLNLPPTIYSPSKPTETFSSLITAPSPSKSSIIELPNPNHHNNNNDSNNPLLNQNVRRSRSSLPSIDPDDDEINKLIEKVGEEVRLEAKYGSETEGLAERVRRLAEFRPISSSIDGNKSTVSNTKSSSDAGTTTTTTSTTSSTSVSSSTSNPTSTISSVTSPNISSSNSTPVNNSISQNFVNPSSDSHHLKSSQNKDKKNGDNVLPSSFVNKTKLTSPKHPMSHIPIPPAILGPAPPPPSISDFGKETSFGEDDSDLWCCK